MKVKTKAKLLSPLLIIAMVVSLMAGALMVAPQAVAGNGNPGGKSLRAEIIAPLDDPVVAPGEEFDVEALIWNEGEWDIPSVHAMIDIKSGPASLVDGETAMKYLGTVTTDWPPGEEYGYQWVSWTLHCDGPGAVRIQVKPFAIPVEGISLTPSSIITVYQAELVIDITQPEDGTWFDTCQTFSVKADITNISDRTIYNVNATIGWYGPASLVGEPYSKHLGDFSPGSTEQVSWTMHCDGYGAVHITVNGTGSSSAGVLPDSVTVHQHGPQLGVDIDAPEKVCVCSEFEVPVTISNTGDETATDVTATINLTNASLTASVTGEDVGTGDGGTTAFPLDHSPVVVDSETVYINDEPETAYTMNYATGIITFDSAPSIGVAITADYSYYGATTGEKTVGDILPGESAVVTWTVHCDSTGTATINVTAEDASGVTASDDAYVSQYDDFYVLITAPDDYAVYDVCDSFPVTATVTNCGDETLTDVDVTIGLPSEVELVVTDPPQDPTQTVDPIAVGGSESVTWTVHCKGAGYGTITVIAGVTTDSDSVTVIQGKAHLVGEIYYPPIDVAVIAEIDDAFAVSQEFHVLAGVNNTGGVTATGVTATLVTTGPVELMEPAEKSVGTVYYGDEKEVMWKLHCTGPGEVTIDMTLAGTDANTGEAIPEANIDIVPEEPITVRQLPLEVVITDPKTDTYLSTSQNFYVNAEVTNTGDETIEDVVASITITPDGAAKVTDYPSQKLTKTLGDIRPHETHDVSWTLHCDGPGDVDIMVTASVENTSAQTSSDPVTVHQQYPPELYVWIMSPESGTSIGTGQEFTVSAVIFNVGEADATDVTATIEIDPELVAAMGMPASAHVVSSPEDIDTIPGGGYEMVTWTLRCDWSKFDMPTEIAEFFGMATDIVVTATWTDANTGDTMTTEPATVSVYQYPAAYLVVDISAPDDGSTYTVCDEFDVTATVTNTGWADAWDVSLTLSVYPEGSVVLMEGGYTQDVGCLAGYGQDGSATVTWKVHCKQSCSTTITVTAAGQDEFGYQVVTDVTYFEDEYIYGYYDGWVEGWYEYDGESYGYWDGYIVGWFDGGLDGYFAGMTDYGPYYDYISDGYSGYIDGYYTGNIYEAYFNGYVDGYFTGWNEGGWFTGSYTETTVTTNPWAHINEQFIENDSITVKQYDAAPVPAPANLEVDISYPDAITAGQDYAVTAVVSNTGEVAATDVDVTLTIAGHASLLIGEYLTQTIDTIAAGSSATVEWVLHADDEGGVNVAVSATGTDTNTASDSGAVQQAAAPVPALLAATGFAAFGWLLAPILVGLGFVGLMMFLGLRRRA